jgi:ribosomal protein L12E/L44/L45/RPP1/RPP2
MASTLEVSANVKTQLAYSYATLLLADSEKPVNAANLEAVVKAAGLKVDANWTASIEKALKGKDINTWFSGGGAGGASSSSSAPAKSAPAAKKEEVKPKEEPKPEEGIFFAIFLHQFYKFKSLAY